MASVSTNSAPSGVPDLLKAAGGYWNMGFNVLPIGKDKRPAIPGWKEHHKERQTWEAVKRLAWGGASGVAGICGQVSGGLVCVDFDGTPAQDAQSLLSMIGLPFSYSWLVRTGSGQGWHVWVLSPELTLTRMDNPGKSTGHIEIRYTGHYAILPPSTHPSGGRYEFVNGFPTSPPAIVPGDVLVTAYRALIVPKNPPPSERKSEPHPSDGRGGYVAAAVEGELSIIRGTQPGNRNNQLFESALKCGGWIGQEGVTRSGLESTLLEAALSIGLHETEARATIKSGLDKAQPRNVPESRPAPVGRPAAPPMDDETVQSIKDARLNDVGNGQRLVERHAGEILYCHEWQNWLFWNGARWEGDNSAEIERRAKAVAAGLHDEAAAIPSEREKLRDAYKKHAERSHSAGKIRAMIDMARSEAAVSAAAGDFDRDNWLLNADNGIIDLRTGELLPHDPGLKITKMIATSYIPGSTRCPGWLSFLNRVMDGNQDLIDFLQRAVGYSLTGDTSAQVLFFLYGSGANGKSTFLETLRYLMADYSQNTPISSLMRKSDGGSPTPDLARLKGARFVTAVEAEENQFLSESTVKAITGGDTITARYLFSNPFEFSPQLKLWVGTNYKPRISGTDNGIWRRIRLIPFTVTIPPEERNPHLPEILRRESVGILSWAVQGCLQWQAAGGGVAGLGTPQEVTDATNAYRSEQDVIAAFIDECCYVGNNARTPAATLYETYKGWAEQNNERVLSQRALASKLTDRGFEPHKGTGGTRNWLGIGVLDSGASGTSGA